MGGALTTFHPFACHLGSGIKDMVQILFLNRRPTVLQHQGMMSKMNGGIKAGKKMGMKKKAEMKM